jgi:hypothetical protein
MLNDGYTNYREQEAEMFLLSNIHNRNYHTLYPDIRNACFDLSDEQVANQKNVDWRAICVDSIVCVVDASRKVSTFRRIEHIERALPRGESVEQNVIAGQVIAKLDPAYDMTTLLKRFGVSHRYLPNNQFSFGFNVADLGSAFDTLQVKAGNKLVTLGSLAK